MGNGEGMRGGDEEGIRGGEGEGIRGAGADLGEGDNGGRERDGEYKGEVKCKRDARVNGKRSTRDEVTGWERCACAMPGDRGWK